MRRVLVISHTYLPPTNRGKLHALAARGLDIAVGVPERWRDRVLGSTTEVSWERQNGVEVCPLHEPGPGIALGQRADDRDGGDDAVHETEAVRAAQRHRGSRDYPGVGVLTSRREF